MTETKTIDMSSPEWEDFVLSNFAPSELFDDKPKVSGLRRVARKLLGPILVSKPKMWVSTADYACVEWYLKILWTRLEPGIDTAYPVIFGDIADVHSNNAEPMFSRFGPAVAATRAEGRALRKALQLSKACAEEITMMPIGDDDKILKQTISFIDNLCKSLDISVMDYINLGDKKYSRIEELSQTRAGKFCEHLSSLSTEKSKGKPHNLKLPKYNPKWRS